MYRPTRVCDGPPIVPVRVDIHHKVVATGPYASPYCTKYHDQRYSNHQGGPRSHTYPLLGYPPFIFHPDAPYFSLSVLTRGAQRPAFPSNASTAHAALELTETDALDHATLAAASSGKINSNYAQPTDVQTAPPSPPANPDSDIM